MNLRKRLRNKVLPFKFTPFSTKQLKALTWWDPEYSPYAEWDAIIADGSIRSGKTVSLSLSYVLWAMSQFEGKNFGIAGKTIHACRRNVINPLKQMLLSRGFEIVDVRNENMLIIAKQDIVDGEKVEIVNYFYIFGGKDESSQDLIQGVTLAGLFCDEVALMPESFVSQATGRCSEQGSKFWFSCNPNNPMHWFKKEWIDKAVGKKFLYLHFTMDDNPSLDPKVKERYEKLYTGVFYKRFILGLWVTADGLVYPMFKEERNVTEFNAPFDRIFVAGDFGIYNATTFGVYGYYRRQKRYHLIESYYHSGREAEKQVMDYDASKSNAQVSDILQKTTKEYADDVVAMIRQGGYQIEYIILDPSAAAMIVELQKHPYIVRKGIEVIPAMNDVMLGISFHSQLLTEGRFTVDPSNTYDIEEYMTYSWDAKKSDAGKDEVTKENDHCMDRNRYACLTDAWMNDEFGFEIEVLSGKGARTA